MERVSFLPLWPEQRNRWGYEPSLVFEPLVVISFLVLQRPSAYHTLPLP